jgi:hypothetical protein
VKDYNANQSTLERALLSIEHNDITYCGILCSPVLDLTYLHPLTADFDLRVAPAEECERAILILSHQIAGTLHVPSTAEAILVHKARVRQQRGGGPPRFVQVAAGQLRPFDQ